MGGKETERLCYPTISKKDVAVNVISRLADPGVSDEVHVVEPNVFHAAGEVLR